MLHFVLVDWLVASRPTEPSDTNSTSIRIRNAVAVAVANWLPVIATFASANWAYTILVLFVRGLVVVVAVVSFQ